MAIVSEIDYQEAVEAHLGFCTECESFTTECVEPDAEEYVCDECGCETVVGAEFALISGLFEIEGD